MESQDTFSLDQQLLAALVLVELGDRKMAVKLLEDFAGSLKRGEEIPLKFRHFIAHRIEVMASGKALAFFGVKTHGEAKKVLEKVGLYLAVQEIHEKEGLPLSDGSDPNAYSAYAERLDMKENTVVAHFKGGKKLFAKARAKLFRKLYKLEVAKNIENARSES